MKLKLNVTPADIRLGVPEDGCKCPIALALIRAATEAGIGLTAWEVDDVTIELTTKEEEMHCRCTPLMSEFVVDFDDGDDVYPFEQEVEFVSKYEDLQ